MTSLTPPAPFLTAKAPNQNAAPIPKLTPTIDRPTQLPIKPEQLVRVFLTLWNLMAWVCEDASLLQEANAELQGQLMSWPPGFTPEGAPIAEPSEQPAMPT